MERSNVAKGDCNARMGSERQEYVQTLEALIGMKRDIHCWTYVKGMDYVWVQV